MVGWLVECISERSVMNIETFSALLALCAGNSPVTMNSHHKGQWRGALMFRLICAWINGWINNREAGNFRRNRAHYDVIVWLNSFVRYCVYMYKLYSHICLVYIYNQLVLILCFQSKRSTILIWKSCLIRLWGRQPATRGENDENNL